MHPPGAFLLKLCTRDFPHAPSYYVLMKKSKKKSAHSGCTPPKIVHPAAEMGSPGAGCTLNFGHCIKTQLLKLIKITFCLPCPINSIAGDPHCAPCACQREPGCSVPAGGDPGYSAGH